MTAAVGWPPRRRLQADGGCASASSRHVYTDDCTRASAQSVLFLDVDGVLHSNWCDELFEDAPMRHLKDVLQRSGAVICLSSSWRCSSWGVEEVNAQLERLGLDPVVDRTPLHGFATRSDEIVHWLALHPLVERCAPGSRTAGWLTDVCPSLPLTCTAWIAVCRGRGRPRRYGVSRCDVESTRRPGGRCALTDLSPPAPRSLTHPHGAPVAAHFVHTECGRAGSNPGRGSRYAGGGRSLARV